MLIKLFWTGVNSDKLKIIRSLRSLKRLELILHPSQRCKSSIFSLVIAIFSMALNLDCSHHLSYFLCLITVPKGFLCTPVYDALPICAVKIPVSSFTIVSNVLMSLPPGGEVTHISIFRKACLFSAYLCFVGPSVQDCSRTSG